MGSMSLPGNATGRVGMVASLKRLGPSLDGRLVLVREPAGFVTELVGSPRPVFAWLVQSLGDLVDCRGKPSRTIYVADACLVPVTNLPPDAAGRLASEQSQGDVDVLAAQARAMLAVCYLSESEQDRLLEEAAEQALIAHALEVAPVEATLREVGFREDPAVPGGLLWAGIHEGVELVVSAAPRWLFGWTLQTNGVSPRQLICHECVIPAELPRGQAVREVLQLWRSAFGDGMVPDAFKLGVTYEQHQAAMKILNPGLPTLSVEPRAFRQILKWLDPGVDTLRGGDEVIRLSYADGMLRVGTDEFAYGCPAWGQWALDCSVRLADLIGLRSQLARARKIHIERGEARVYFNWLAIGLLSSEGS